ncbi:MAG: hypothetical protein LLG05_09795 [Porphyromonadaceae bacterium]|nr:hypothetical protein [Porphyromonadaceae bacterium]
MTALTFFPERFYMPFADEVHGKIFDLIDGPEQKVAIAAPRGYGKTSIVALALIARWILFNHTGFVVYINKSHDAASLQTENLRRELVTNKEIKAFFGDFKQREPNKAEFDEVFSKKAWVAYNTLAAHVEITYIWNYGVGLLVNGDGYDCNYNQIWIGGIWDCMLSIKVLPSLTGGAANENTFYGGALGWSGSQDLTNHAHINIYRNYTTNVASANNNRFYGQALEDGPSTGGTAIGVYVDGGYNYFNELRMEMNATDTHFNFSADSVGNLVFYGVGVNSMALDVVDAGSLNKFFGVSEMWLNGNTDTTGHGVLNLFNTGADGYKALSVWDHLGTTNKFSVTSNGVVNAATEYDIAGTKVLGARNTGWVTMGGTILEDCSSVNADTVTATDANIRLVARCVKALIDAGITHGLIGP